jgi:hypothetical protein
VVNKGILRQYIIVCCPYRKASRLENSSCVEEFLEVFSDYRKAKE